MKRMFAKYTGRRTIRVLAGLLLLIQAIIMKDILFAFLAAFLLFTGLANVPCCGAGEACSVDTKDRLMKNNTTDERLDPK